MKFEDRYPQGKLGEHDEGVLTIKIAMDPETKTVIIDFGKPVVWIGLSKEEAFDFARRIMRFAVDKVVSVDVPMEGR